MKKFLSATILLLLLLPYAQGVLAQEGHPFTGTWRGRLIGAEENLPVLVIMNYDGDKLQGMINPGRNSYPFQTVEHDAPNWRLAVTAQNKQNQAISFTGVMHDIGSPVRYIEGTWQQAGKTYSFRITRE